MRDGKPPRYVPQHRKDGDTMDSILEARRRERQKFLESLEEETES